MNVGDLVKHKEYGFFAVIIKIKRSWHVADCDVMTSFISKKVIKGLKLNNFKKIIVNEETDEK